MNDTRRDSVPFSRESSGEGTGAARAQKGEEERERERERGGEKNSGLERGGVAPATQPDADAVPSRSFAPGLSVSLFAGERSDVRARA